MIAIQIRARAAAQSPPPPGAPPDIDRRGGAMAAACACTDAYSSAPSGLATARHVHVPPEELSALALPSAALSAGRVAAEGLDQRINLPGLRVVIGDARAKVPATALRAQARRLNGFAVEKRACLDAKRGMAAAGPCRGGPA
jgi:hypothetical protein